MRSRTVAGIAALVAVATLAGCGDPADVKAVKGRVDGYFHAMGTGDWSAACSYLFDRTTNKPFVTEPAKQATCATNQAKYTQLTPEGKQSLAATKVTKATVTGSTAIVHQADLGNSLATDPDGTDVTLRLVSGSWYIDNQ